ncbi:hypothetical protein HMPREF1595_04123 [Escherichia coli 907672]|nr:hypothetical protein ECARS42123_0054 [Escherichia coli ARS4.2123]ESD04742.1 hypothetical protein HMPREF1595_04123 [Escherichia coli 907672]
MIKNDSESIFKGEWQSVMEIADYFYPRVWRYRVSKSVSILNITH